eukprot:gene12176-16306_t
MEEGANITLHVGDLILLMDVNTSLCSEGLLGEDCYLINDSARIDDCIWEVHVQNQYSALREYRENIRLLALNSYHHEIKNGSINDKNKIENNNQSSHLENGSISAPTSEKNFEHIQQLFRAAVNEQRLNEKLMSIKIGKPVAFGDPIQLRHVKSGKFLTVSADALAKEERENMKITVENGGDSLSWLSFAPKYKYYREGQHITNNAEIFLKVLERPGEYIHTAKKLTTESLMHVINTNANCGEVNCSLESTNWIMKIYQPTNKAQNLSVLAGQLVALQDPDSLSYLTVNTTEDGKVTSNKVKVVMSSQFHISGGFSLDKNVGTNLLWCVEKNNNSIGGTISFSSDNVTLKDLNSGMYMRLERDGLYAVKDREEASLFEMSNSQLSASMSTWLMQESTINLSADGLWVGLSSNNQNDVDDDISENSEDSKYDNNINKPADNGMIKVDTSKYDEQSNSSSKSTSQNKNSKHLINCSGRKDRSEALSLIVSLSLFKKIGYHLHVGTQATRSLRKFHSEMQNLSKSSISRQTETNLIRTIRTVYQTSKSLIKFLSAHDNKSDLYNVDLIQLTNPPSKKTISIRQTMMREQGLVTVLLDILELTKANSFDFNNNNVLILESDVTTPETRRKKSTHGWDHLQRINSIPEHQNENQRVENDNISLNGIASIPRIIQRRNSGHLLVPKHDTIPDAEKIAMIKKKLTINKSFSINSGTMTDMLDNNNIRSNNSSNNLLVNSKFPTNKRQTSKLPSFSIANSSNHEDKQTVGQKLSFILLKVLYHIIVENHANQMYVSDRFPVLLHHVSEQKLAVECVQEMLSDNLPILQTKVRQREIDIFIKLLSEKEMCVTYLKLLRSTCSCPMGVDATQRMVATALFGDVDNKGLILYDSGINSEFPSRTGSFDDGTVLSDNTTSQQGPKSSLILRIQADRTNTISVTWDESSVYYPQNPLDQVLAYKDLSKGLPQICISWSGAPNKPSEYSMLQLFGFEEKVPLENICDIFDQSAISENKTANNNPAFSSTRFKFSYFSTKTTKYNSNLSLTAISNKISNTSIHSLHPTKSLLTVRGQNRLLYAQNQSLRKNLAEYLIAELYLVADLCLDRNYVAIQLLERLFEYDVLVSMLKDAGNHIPNVIKAPVCRILRCLYVDREPQVIAKYPRLIRTSASFINNGELDESSANATGEFFKFALIQQLISEYITNKLDIKKCDALSVEMISLLQTLVSFGFYCTNDQIEDIIVPLVKLLDDHRTEPEIKAKEISDNDNNNSLTYQSTKKSSRINAFNLTTSGENSSHFNRSIHSNDLLLGKVASKKNDLTDSNHNNDSDLHLNSQFSFSGKQIRKTKSYLYPNADETNSLTQQKPWELRYLLFIESLPGMILLLTVVILTVMLIILQILLSLPQISSNSVIIDNSITAFYFLELSIRIYCFVRVRSLQKFMSDPFNLVDTFLVVLDLILLSFNAYLSQIKLARIIRILRIIRVIRVLRAARIMKKIADQREKILPWSIPKRYSHVTKDEVQTMLNVLKVLSMLYDRIQDKRLGLTIKAFVIWNNDRKKNISCDAVDIYNKKVTQENISKNISANFDYILLDIMMYSDTSLVQEALHLLMNHTSQREIFRKTSHQIQILYSPKVEDVFRNLSRMLRDLQRLAEMFEIWSELSNDEDIASAHETLDILKKIKGFIMKNNDDKTLSIRSEVLVDEEVQILLRNLDAMTTFMTVLEALYDGGRDIIKDRILLIMQACTNLICWFVKNSETNQVVAYKYFDWFVDRIDDNINSEKVIRAILEGNIGLVKQVPKTYLSLFAHKISKNGQKPEYLDLYVGMTEYANLTDSRVIAVENVISSYLTSREWKHHFLLWCSGPLTDGYHERRMVMKKVSNPQTTLTNQSANYENNINPNSAQKANIYADERLPPSLQYHLRLLTLLASCNLGPKLQAIYPISDVLYSLQDPATIPPVKRGLGYLLNEVLQDGVEKVEKNELFWRLLEDFANMLEVLPNELFVLMSSNQSVARIIKGEWLDIAINIIITFFDFFELTSYNETIHFEQSNHSFGRHGHRNHHSIHIAQSISLSTASSCSLPSILPAPDTTSQSFRIQSKDNAFAPNNLHFNQDHHTGYVVEPALLMKRLHNSIHLLVKDHSNKLGFALSDQFKFALSVLEQHGTKVHFDHDKTDSDSFTDSKLKLAKNNHRRSSIVYADVQQATYRTQFISFIKQIHSYDYNIQNDAIKLFESIPYQDDMTQQSDVRFDPLIKKLTTHLRQVIRKPSSFNKIFDDNAIDSTVWILKVFRNLYENKLGITVDEYTSVSIDMQHTEVLNEDSFSSLFNNASKDSLKETPQLAKLRSVYSENGVINLCLDLIAIGIPSDVYIEAMKLLVILLLKKGGSKDIQARICDYLLEHDSVLFFELLKDIIESLKARSSKETENNAKNNPLTNKLNYNRTESISNLTAAIIPTNNDDKNNSNNKNFHQNQPAEMIVFNLIQLMCTGGFIRMKNIFREQINNDRSVNIIGLLASYMGVLSSNDSANNTYVSIIVLKTILRLVLGPCKGNQEQFVLQTELLLSLNRIIRSSRPKSVYHTLSSKADTFHQSPSTVEVQLWVIFLEKLKEMIIDVLCSLIEGQSENSLVFERVTTTVELSVLNLLVFPPNESSNTTSNPAIGPSSNQLMIDNMMSSNSNGHSNIKDSKATKNTNDNSFTYQKSRNLQVKYLIFIKTLGNAISNSHNHNINHMLLSTDANTLSILSLTPAQTNNSSIHSLTTTSSSTVSLHSELSSEVDFIKKDIRCVEVVWNYAVHKIYFHTPNLAQSLSQESIQQALEKVEDIASQELKLLDFIKQAKIFYNIAKHQQMLVSYGLANLTALKYYLTRIMFLNAVAMNVLILAYFGTMDHSKVYNASNHRFLASSGSTGASPTAVLYMPHEAAMIVNILNIAQIILAGSVVFIFMVVHMPVKYSYFCEKKISRIVAILYTIIDPLPCWYFIYFLFTIASLLFDRLFITVLLLDWIVLDPTTADLMLAILNPAKQLAATLVILVIMMNLFTGVIFALYRTDVIGFDIYDMWEAFKLSLSYGFRGEYGVGHEMVNTLGPRLILDVIFYFIILAILRQILFAIIVDTFGELREIKHE